MELQSREEEIRFLTMEVKDNKRSLGLLRSNVPDKKALDNELVTLQIDLLDAQK